MIGDDQSLHMCSSSLCEMERDFTCVLIWKRSRSR